MWDEIVHYVEELGSPVLTWIDAEGYPRSARCEPQPETSLQVLQVTLPGHLEVIEGPASLMGHQHNEELWELKNYVVRGYLKQCEVGWYFTPTAFIPGNGIGGFRGMVKGIRKARRTTRDYLERRGLPRPKVPWHEVKALQAEAAESRQKGLA